MGIEVPGTRVSPLEYIKDVIRETHINPNIWSNQGQRNVLIDVFTDERNSVLDILNTSVKQTEK